MKYKLIICSIIIFTLALSLFSQLKPGYSFTYDENGNRITRQFTMVNI